MPFLKDPVFLMFFVFSIGTPFFQVGPHFSETMGSQDPILTKSSAYPALFGDPTIEPLKRELWVIFLSVDSTHSELTSS